MKRARKKVTPKKRGRPATGKDPHVSIRLPAELIAAIDKSAKAEGVSRSEKIRALIERAL
jgi:predicted DNA binding CopG/RHH family protein